MGIAHNILETAHLVIQDLHRQGTVVLADGKSNVLGAVAADRLQNNIHINVALAQLGENLKGNTGGVLQADHRDTSHIFILGYAANEHFFHFCYLLNNGAGNGIQRGEHLQLHAVLLCHLYGAVVEHLCTQGGQLQHFVISDFFQLLRILHLAGIGSVYALHIGKDLAFVCIQCSSDSHRRGIGPAAPQCG